MMTNQLTLAEINVSVSSPPPETIAVPIAGEAKFSVNDDGQSCIVSPTIGLFPDQSLAVAIPTIEPSCSTSTGTGSISISAVSPTDPECYLNYMMGSVQGATLLNNYTSNVVSGLFYRFRCGNLLCPGEWGSGACAPILWTT